MLPAEIRLVRESEGAAAPTWTLCAVGDFCIGSAVTRPVNQLVDDAMLAMIGGADVAVVNVEGAVRAGARPIQKSGPWVELHPDGAAKARELGFHIATLANNHIGDFGPLGIDATLHRCRAAGLATTGVEKSHAEALMPAFRDCAGQRIGVMAVCEREFGIADQDGEGSAAAGAAWISHPETRRAVSAAASQCDVLIVAAHGGIEYSAVSPIQRRNQLRLLIDAGASLVIGHHPHVPQGWEIHRGRLILHSLGNFLFESDIMHGDQSRDWGIMVRVQMAGPRAMAMSALPVRAPASGPRLATMPDSEDRIRQVENLAQTLADEDAAMRSWRDAADQLWRQRYARNLGAATNIGPIEQAKNLLRDVRAHRSRRGLFADAGMTGDRKRQLDLLNLFRNESHRWVMETVLKR